MKNIKRAILHINLILVITITLTAFQKSATPISKENKGERVSFKIKGTGYKKIFVTIGIGHQPGSGACCTGVSENSTVSFMGNVGDVVYDGKTRRVITKVYKELEGTTINLADYY
jgi:hypothetical protein